MQIPVVIVSEEDGERARARLAELESAPRSAEVEDEIAAITDAILRWEMRRDGGEE